MSYIFLPKLNNNLQGAIMGRTLNRRARTPNWSYEEKKYLLRLIKERRTLLFNSNTSPNPFEKDKSAAWTGILQALIVKFGNKFQGSTVKKIKTQWQNMKRMAREDVSQHGTSVQKYSEQTMDVCYILGLVVNEDQVVMDPHSTSVSSCADVIVKTERMDDDNDCDPCCSSTRNLDESEESTFNHNESSQLESSSSSVSCHQSEAEGSDNPEPSGLETSSVIRTLEVVAQALKEGNKENINQVDNQINQQLSVPAPSQNEQAQSKYSITISGVEIVKADDPAPKEVIDVDAEHGERPKSTPKEKDQMKPDNVNEGKRRVEMQVAEVNNDEDDGDDDDSDHREPSEKQIKLDIIKEERQVVRAMRETAELNKIIAEQRLKHILWMRKRDMMYTSGDPGSGAGKGGGGGGSIRDAGGAFGKQQVAREEEYFYRKQKEQISDLKTHLDKEIAFHKDQIKRHEDAIKRHEQKMHDMEKQ